MDTHEDEENKVYYIHISMIHKYSYQANLYIKL